MKDGSYQHQMKGNRTDVFRAAFNADNKARFYEDASRELISLLQRSEQILRLNPAAGPLLEHIHRTFKKYEVEVLPEPTLTAAVEEPRT